MVTPLARFEPLLSALKPEFFTTLPWRSPPGGKGPLLSTQQLSLCSVGYQKGTVVCVCGGGGVVQSRHLNLISIDEPISNVIALIYNG